MTDSFQAAAIIASDFCFVKKQIACIFVAFLCRNVLESAPAKGCRDQKSRKIFLKNLKNRFCSPRGTEKKVKEHPESDITFGGAWLRSHTKCEKGFGNSQHASALEDFMDGDALLAR